MQRIATAKPSQLDYTFSAKEFTNLREAHAPEEESMSMSQALDNLHDDDDGVLPPPTSTAAVRSALSSTRFASYLQDFDAEAERESRVFCSVPASIVDDSARAQLLAAGIEKEDDELQHRNELEHIDFLKRNRILELEAKRQARRADQLHNLRSIDRQRQQTSELVETYYDHARLELDIHLTSRQGEVSQHIGEIRKFRHGDYDPDKPDWKQFEQQVHIRVVKIRGVKDKIPEGNYIVLVSKWEKMGGVPHRWSNRGVNDAQPPTCPLHQDTTLPERSRCEICNGWAGATTPVTHSGLPKEYEIGFDTKLYTFFQAQTRVKPYNCLMFELVRLVDKDKQRRAGEVDPRPQVVGWGVIPIVDSKFAVVNGKFRFPMLRGPYKPQYGHYKTVQDDIVGDLENWLGNIYVDIYPFPREHFGRSEFQLQQEFSNRLLNLNEYPSAKDAEGWPYDSRKRGLSIDLSNDQANKLVIMGKEVAVADFFTEEEFPYHRPAIVEEQDTPALTRWNMIRVAVFNLSRQKRIEQQKEQKEAIQRLEQGKVFRYSIHPYGATILESTWRIQVEYCMRAIKDDLSLREPWTFKFWLVVLVFFTSLYFQLYVHSAFVYIAVRAAGIPVDSADPTWYGINVQYLHRKTYPLDELFVVFFSLVSMYFVLMFEIALGWLFKFSAGTIPEQLSKFVFTTSLAAMLIPWVELALDGINHQRRSDWLRLWDFMNQHSYGQYYSFIIFFIIYGFLFAGCVVSTFLYTMALHLNGILQDSYWRILVVNEETCHIPDDLEVSTIELKHILHRAERWRGKNGERRKTSVTKMLTTDDKDPDYTRVDLHVQVCQLNCGSVERWKVLQDYEIYREFFITEEGAILEVVGGENTPHGVSFMMNNLVKKLKLTGFGNGEEANAGEALKALFGFGGGGAGLNGSTESPKKAKRAKLAFSE